ncbi:MAG: glycosyltransferase [Acidobacteriota bacterium]|nr:glycosyltransferase [Acidobacteriota bacterium]
MHSRYSDRPSEWFLRRIGAPESFTEPLEVYRRARERGMDFVTISDHDCIRGALEIAHLPGTFISNEVTASFPEDGAKIHLLVLGISEEQHRMIDELRENLYELSAYLRYENIVHSVAHALFQVNDRLTVAHLEKLILLFQRFEGINGTRDPRACLVLRTVLDHLTPAMIDEMAHRHKIEPEDDEPWKKIYTAGSDDHSGLYIASAYTETPESATVEEFLEHLRKGRHAHGGRSGSTLQLARNFHSIAYRYYRETILGSGEKGGDLLDALFTKLLDGEVPTGWSRAEKIRSAATAFLRPRKKTMGQIDREVAEALASLASLGENPGEEGVDRRCVERRCFDIAARLGHQLSYASVHKGLKYLRKGKLTEALQSVASLAPVTLCLAPYLVSFQTQHKDEKLVRAVAEHFPAARELRRKGLRQKGVGSQDSGSRGGRKAWFTDTLTDINGVAKTVRTCAELAARGSQNAGDRDLVVISSLEEPPEVDFPLRNFAPVGTFPLPEYEDQELAFPPFLEIVEYCERAEIGEIVVSTPGPLGLVGVLAARLLGIEVTGIYHTDFPLYVRHLTESPGLEEMTWRYMRWFYNQMHRIYAPSRAYVESLEENGFPREKLRLLPRGVDVELFSPQRRDPELWQRYGLGEGFKLLYVGRISKEKNLDQLMRAFLEVQESRPDAQLVLVGDGPYLDELHSRYRRPEVLFTGYLHGEELGTAFASADLFVFPSTTDTFGNAVLEAQASGLAAVVSNQGGAQEIVGPSSSGAIVDLDQPGALAASILELMKDSDQRLQLAMNGLRSARGSSWISLLDELWSEPATVRPSAPNPLAPALDTERERVAAAV